MKQKPIFMFYIKSKYYTTFTNSKAFTLLLVFIFTTFKLFSQGENNIWCFGDSNLLDFKTNSILLSKSSTNQRGGSSTISDKIGNLLFYSNGLDVWDATHNRMPNGFGLYGDTFSSQSCLIVKKPLSTNLYYIFTTSHIGRYGTSLYKGLCYSIVDMNLNGGKGDIVAGMKNIPLKNPCSEKIAATFHANQRDIWVVTREVLNNRFVAYLLTPSGIIDSIFSNSDRDYGLMLEVGQGTISISPNSKLLACCSYGKGLDLYKFNNSNGQINFIYKDTIIYNVASSIFSPNSKLLYFATDNKIYQYNISLLDSLYIYNSLNHILTIPTPYQFEIGLSLSRNNKIYFSPTQYNHLGIINNPDSIGLKCDPNLDEIKLPTICKFGLQNIYYFYLPSIYAINTCLDDTTRFHISDTSWMSKIIWNFGDGTGDTAFYPKHVYADTGTYHVTATYYYTCDSVRVQYKDVKIETQPTIHLISDGIFKCASDYNFIIVRGNMDSVLWENNNNDTARQIFSPGTYKVKGFNQCGMDSAEIIIPASPSFEIDLEFDKRVILNGEKVKLTNENFDINNIINYSWSPIYDSCINPPLCSNVIVSPNETTLYSVTAINIDSCMSTDSITIIVRQDKAVFIPTVFTPNGDGKNETFDFQILAAKSVFVSIWNKWGEKIYENPMQQNGAGQGWDGTYKGKEMPLDTYTYQFIVQYFDDSIKTFSGTVTVMK